MVCSDDGRTLLLSCVFHLPSLAHCLTLLVQPATSVWFKSSLSGNKFPSEPIKEALEISSFSLILHSSLLLFFFLFSFSRHLSHWCCYAPLSFSFYCTKPHFYNALLMTASVFFIKMRKRKKKIEASVCFKCLTKKSSLLPCLTLHSRPVSVCELPAWCL